MSGNQAPHGWAAEATSGGQEALRPAVRALCGWAPDTSAGERQEMDLRNVGEETR